MFGINPGYSPINNPKEEIEARKSWEHYQKLYLNLFLFFYEHKFESPYYTSLAHLLSGLTGEEKKSKWELFDSYLTNLELIPYISVLQSLKLKSIYMIPFTMYRNYQVNN